MRNHRGLKQLTIALTLVLTVGCSTAGGLQVETPSATAPTAVAAPLTPIALSSEQLLATIPIEGGELATLVIGEEAVWVRSAANGKIYRIDPQSNSVVDTITTSSRGWGLAVQDDALWAPNTLSDEVHRIDLQSGEVIATIPAGDFPAEMAISRGAVWVNTPDMDAGVTGGVWRIDPILNMVVAAIPVTEVEGRAGAGLAATTDALWTTTIGGTLGNRRGMLVRIDPQTNEIVTTIPIRGMWCNSIVANEEAIWLACSFGPHPGVIERVDPRTNELVATLELDAMPWDVAIGPDAVWALTQDNDLLRIDLESNQIVEQLDLGDEILYESGALEIDEEGTLWIINEAEQALWRIKP
ncbi:MAG: hypothetical protein M3220_07870 [Chloroflexota bacterium]|nr:hypothetical protein [Chloroflexota bacterium]